MMLGIKSLIRTHKGFLLINIILLVVYFSIGFSNNYISNIKNSLFIGDSRHYINVSDFMYGRSGGDDQIISRTYFYPLLLGIRLFFGDYSIYIMQVVFYILSINILSRSIFLFCKSRLMYYLSFIVFMLNIAVNMLTYRALTEITSILLSSVFVYLFVKYDFRLRNKLTFLLPLLLSILTVTRPNYLIEYMIFVFTMLVYFITKKERLIIYFLMVLVSSLPILFQVKMYYGFTGEIGISKIADRTFQAYYLSRVYSEKKGISLLDARAKTLNWSVTKRLNYLSKDPHTSLNIFIRTLVIDNVIAHTSESGLAAYQTFYNSLLLFFHIMFAILFFPLIIFTNRSREQKLIVTILYSFSLFIIVSSGLSFGQGDRLVTPALPFWLFVYSFMSVELYKRIRKLLDQIREKKNNTL